MSLMDARMNFIDSLAEGSLVAEGGRGDTYTISRVARLTKTQIVLENGSRYRRADGHMVGGDVWTTGMVHDPASKYVVKARHEQLVRVRHAALAKILDRLRVKANHDDIAALHAAADSYEAALVDLENLV